MIDWLPILANIYSNGRVWLDSGSGFRQVLNSGYYSNVSRLDNFWYVAVGDVAQSDWLHVGISGFLIAASLVLALKSRSWAVNFLFGLSLVGFLGWVFANATVEVYGGWLLFMVLVGAVLVLVKGAVLVRASGV